jgi:tetratricopeptide (TPR) repeat protein
VLAEAGLLAGKDLPEREGETSMSSIRKTALAAFSVLVAVWLPARASDLADVMTLHTQFYWTRSFESPDRARHFVQKSHDLALVQDSKKISSTFVGVIYRREKVDGDRLLLSARSRGLEGWVSAGAVVPISEAEAFFSQEIVRHPEEPFSLLMRGIVRFECGDTERAFADVNEALRINPKNIDALATRGGFWHFTNRPDRAFADVNKGLELDAQNPDLFVSRGMLYAAAKEFGKALADLDRATKLGARQRMIPLMRGMIYLEKDELEKSEIELVRAREFDREGTDVLVFLAMIRMQRSRADEAMSLLDEAIQLDPKNGWAFGLRAVLYWFLSDSDKALADLEQAIRLQPRYAQHVQNHSMIMFKRADFDTALADIEKAIRLDPTNPGPHQGRAWILMACPIARIRNANQAVISATRACELSRWSKSLYLATLAAAYSEKGDFESAAKWQEAAMAKLDVNAEERTQEYRALLECYKKKTRYRAVGSWRELALRHDDTQRQPSNLATPF